MPTRGRTLSHMRKVLALQTRSSLSETFRPPQSLYFIFFHRGHIAGFICGFSIVYTVSYGHRRFGHWRHS